MFSIRKIAISAMVMAIYIVLMYLMQSFAFGQVQVRVATSLYALAGVFPFLILPLGLANGLANLMMSSPMDAVCGLFIGIITSSVVYWVRKFDWLVFLPICFVVGLGVPIWLSVMLYIPYWVLAVNLLMGQAVCGVLGVLLLKGVKKIWKMN